MKILYLRREYDQDGFLKKRLRSFKRELYFSDQDGFFEQSLFTAADVSEATLDELPHKIQEWNKSFDAIVINSKSGTFSCREQQLAFLQTYLPKCKIPKVLFLGAAQAELVFGDAYFDLFDLIYKREPFIDRDRYDLSEVNKKKIYPTMIYCPFLPGIRDNIISKAYHTLNKPFVECKSSEKQYDLGFLGALSGDHTIREDVWRWAVRSRFSTIGGLQYHPHHGRYPDDELQSPRLKGSAYRNALCRAKINFALDGIGQFTFRHLELLYLGLFMVSSPSIKEIELPLPLVENVHFVSFNSLEELEQKVTFYLQNNEERSKIANAGKEWFEAAYNPLRHGNQIIGNLEKIIH